VTTRRDASRVRRSRAAHAGVAALLAGLALAAAALAVARRDAAVPAASTPPALLPLVLPRPIAAPVHGRRAGTPKRRRAARPVARPVAIAIPAIDVRARVVRLGLNADGTLEVPHDFAATGWWSGGARPGERGPAVIAGHVDSRTGPAVFFRLGRLHRGDVVDIVRRDGSVVQFAVTRLAHYSKAHFPSGAVYGRTRRPALRLITCSGAFDRARGHYVDNTVVYATLRG